MEQFNVISIHDRPELADRAAAWFHQKWGVPEEAYLQSMKAAIGGTDSVPQWYIVLDGERIIGGCGIIENDFHNRPDLTPNLCAVYTEPDFRSRGVAKAFLDYACMDMSKHGVSTLYLLTDHDSFYERYGWEYLCSVMGDGEDVASRMYVKTS
ncbi:MAG: GNAT family N-acetyltransferase [Eubacteriales bacterium]|nr:GNAT family N-acetyltransferase [Eubacteriales bacterium]